MLKTTTPWRKPTSLTKESTAWCLSSTPVSAEWRALKTDQSHPTKPCFSNNLNVTINTIPSSSSYSIILKKQSIFNKFITFFLSIEMRIIFLLILWSETSKSRQNKHVISNTNILLLKLMYKTSTLPIKWNHCLTCSKPRFEVRTKGHPSIPLQWLMLVQIFLFSDQRKTRFNQSQFTN